VPFLGKVGRSDSLPCAFLSTALSDYHPKRIVKSIWILSKPSTSFTILSFSAEAIWIYVAFRVAPIDFDKISAALAVSWTSDWDINRTLIGI